MQPVERRPLVRLHELTEPGLACVRRGSRIDQLPMRSPGFLALTFALRTAAVAAAVVAFVPACVGGKQQISAEDKDRLKANILDAVPPDAKKVDINFENKVHVVGYKVSP